jgi:CRISPR/Cas system-associated exonuclease Cas4 (RecB family)
MKMSYSFSSISTFEDCQRKFKYQYIDKIKVPQTDAMSNGSKVHKEIEKFVNNQPNELSIGYQETIKEFVEDRLKGSKLLSTEHPVIIETPPAIFEQGAWPPSRTRKESTDIYFHGIIDAIYIREFRGKKRVSIVDWKTGKSTPKDLQLKYYLLLAASLFSNISFGPEITGYFLRLDIKKAKVRAIESDQIDLRDTWRKIQENIKEIEKETEYAATTSYCCSYCQYASICDVLKDYTENKDKLAHSTVSPLILKALGDKK